MPIEWVVDDESYVITEETVTTLFPEEINLEKAVEIINTNLPEEKQVSPTLWLARVIAEKIGINIATITPFEALNLINDLAGLQPPLTGYDKKKGSVVVRPTPDHYFPHGSYPTEGAILN